ncbi:MAG: Mur ligase family protein, partial [Lachnospiraceae bacterium]
MLTLEKLLGDLEYQCVQGNTDRQITQVVFDSRNITRDCVFICIEGAKFDGHSAAAAAAAGGAAAIVAQKPVTVSDERVTVIYVENTRYAMACISAAFFGHPARKLKTIGITGTKGKTTTTYLVKSILEHAGYKVGLVGTIEIMTGKRTIPSANTTPESYYLQEYFAEMVDAGCDAVVMEVSSQGLMMHRCAGFVFDYGIFTNIEPDHIGPNEHKDFDDYLFCKSLLFQN